MRWIWQQIAAKMKAILLINASQQDDLSRDANGSSDTDKLFHDKQKTIQKDLQFNNELMKEREQRVRDIESDVLDINQIMKDLNSLVHLQGEAVGECAKRNSFLNSIFILT